MPPKKPLSAEEKELVRAWIASGAVWGTDPIDPFRVTSDKRAGYDWWSLRPIVKPPIPAVKAKRSLRQPLDAFVLKQLEDKGLTLAPEADRRTLIRRLFFDLLGLPPPPQDIEDFVRDTEPTAYEKLVDRLLASPHFGERWARHWLDIVRFGESDGFERDLPRPNAWPYRDWVVDAFNNDMPYDEFVRMQLAGDVLHPKNREALAATGFLVAGPHDIVVPASDRMKAAMRQDEMEDLLAVVGQTFLGLTVNCARCHDHKFDPITQKDYYRLSAALAGVGQGERNAGPKGELVRLRKWFEALQEKISKFDASYQQAILTDRSSAQGGDGPRALAEWRFAEGLEDRLGALHGTLHGSARLDKDGLHLDGKTAYVLTKPLVRDLREKTLEVWARLECLTQHGGGAMGLQTLDGGVFDSIVYGEREPGKWMAGSNFFQRTQDFQGPSETTADRQTVHLAITYAVDGTITCYRDGQPYGRNYKAESPVRFQAESARVIFGARHQPAGGNKMLAGTILRARLHDRALTIKEITVSSGTFVTDQELERRMGPVKWKRRQALVVESKKVQAMLDQRKEREEAKVYAVLPSRPGLTYLLLRGQVGAQGELQCPAGVEAVAGGASFHLKPDSADADRRIALAHWITDPANPLPARVIVNRLWHYHFGAGLVDTPNDFGFNGGRPSHPELLDWLAAELARQKWGLKALHKLMVMSATYRQTSRSRPEAAKLDADNRLLWRASPRRLEAEAIRDSILSVAGDLDQRVGGKGYADTKSYFFKGTQFYDPIDQIGPAFTRRTLYRLWARGGRNPFLDTFDCPDPSTTTPRRSATTTPVQALALLNNAFVIHMAQRLSERLQRETGIEPERQIFQAYLLAYGRAPEQEEANQARKFVQHHGLTAFCRVLFNSSEFVQVD